VTPLEVASALAAEMPTRGGSGGRCFYCLGGVESLPHAPDCPWIAMPSIVAALEGLERVRIMADGGSRPPPRSKAEDILVDIVCFIDDLPLDGDL
jgi:hypothetical protein